MKNESAASSGKTKKIPKRHWKALREAAPFVATSVVVREPKSGRRFVEVTSGARAGLGSGSEEIRAHMMVVLREIGGTGRFVTLPLPAYEELRKSGKLEAQRVKNADLRKDLISDAPLVSAGTNHDGRFTMTFRSEAVANIAATLGECVALDDPENYVETSLACDLPRIGLLRVIVSLVRGSGKSPHELKAEADAKAAAAERRAEIAEARVEELTSLATRRET